MSHTRGPGFKHHSHLSHHCKMTLLSQGWCPRAGVHREDSRRAAQSTKGPAGETKGRGQVPCKVESFLNVTLTLRVTPSILTSES